MGPREPLHLRVLVCTAWVGALAQDVLCLSGTNPTVTDAPQFSGFRVLVTVASHFF